MTRTEPTPRQDKDDSAIGLLRQALADAVTLEKLAGKITPERAMFAAVRLQHLLGSALATLSSLDDDGR